MRLVPIPENRAACSLAPMASDVAAPDRAGQKDLTDQNDDDRDQEMPVKRPVRRSGCATPSIRGPMYLV